MTGYEQFINNAPNLKQGKISRLWELEINGSIDNLLDFSNDFLQDRGLEKTGIKKDNDGLYQHTYNNKYIFAGAVQDGNKVAIRINQI